MKFGLLLHLGAGRHGSVVVPADTIRQAIGLLVTTGGPGIRLMDRLHGEGRVEQSRQESQLEILVEKIRLRGSMTMRELLRSYHRARVSMLRPVVQEAMKAGLVREEEDGRLVVAA